MNQQTREQAMHYWLRRLGSAAVLLAGVAALLALVSGLGHRWGLWHFSTGFQLLRWSAYTAIAGVALSVVSLLLSGFLRRWRMSALAGAALLISAIVIAIPLSALSTAREVPPIHDITTDTSNPPEFEAVLPLRRDAPNSVEYAGEEIAVQQRRAYPDIAPLVLDGPADEAFNAARAAAQHMRWKIVDEDPARGRIEAVATTFWFGFKDDVVVRITDQNGLSRVDIRSTSRVGRSDVGANAARIREYIQRLEEVWDDV